MSNQSVWISEKRCLNYRFNGQHPFNQHRITVTRDLLQQVNALHEQQIINLERIPEEALEQIHAAEYVQAVKQLSLSPPKQNALRRAGKFGLDAGDTPYFANMHQVTHDVVSGTVTAAELVMSGKYKHALHLGGGLHHAMPDRAAGFCIYNDAAVAIRQIRDKYDARVMYIDTDVHHGDGVQLCFYSDPDVFTFSIHETGRYLFPGTGFANERGTDKGFGACLNMPVEPFTEDDSWLHSFEVLLEKAVEHFNPDIIFSQHGCDAHAYDPLSHVRCSMHIYRKMPQLIHQAAHQYCGGRWVALGGGGYDIWRVVPRAWSLLWLEMTDHPLLQQIDANHQLALPENWLKRWQQDSPALLPAAWMDEKNAWEHVPRRQQINETNLQMLEVAAMYL